MSKRTGARPAVVRLRARLVWCAVCVGAAILAIGLSLIAMSVIALVAGAGGLGGFALSGHALHVAVDDGAVAFYLTQLVSVSFFGHTAELRFAALPGLVLVGLAIATTAMVAAKVTQGSVRSRMLLATLTAVPYALLSGLGACYVPLRFTAAGIGNDVAVLPSVIEAFVLPLGWGLLFASVGGLVGVFGRAWRREAAGLLGAWVTPLRCSLRALAAGLALSTVIVLVGGVVLVGRSGDARSLLLGGGFAHAVTGVGAALIALPTLVVSLFLACFGVSFDWHVEALNRTQGSVSILGGTLPSTGAYPTHGMPAAFVLLLLLAAVTVLSAGWLTARRSGGYVRLSMANALRAGALMTLICWLIALLARVDAQAGGYLGLHLEADTASLLWWVPLWCFLGSITGSVAYLVTRDTSTRRQLAAALLVADTPQVPHSRPQSRRQGQLATRVTMSMSVLSLLAILIGISYAGATPAPHPPTISLAPISQAAEQRLRRDIVPGSPLSVSVDPGTRVIDAASIRVPLTALGVSSGQSPIAKAKAMLAHYGDLFGMSGQPNELGEPEVLTDPITKAKSHIYFKQMADGVPVFGNSIGVHLSPDGKYVDSVSGSFIPEVSVANDKAAISSAQAVSLAKEALPAGKLVHPPRLEVYAGASSQPFGPTARLAWFVWMTAGLQEASNEYVIDATTGSILHVFTKSFYLTEPDRKIYGAEKKEELLGELKREEGGKETGDKDTDEAYTNLGYAFNFYKNLREEPWRGYDGENSIPQKLTVHYGKNADKWEWNGAYKAIVLGDEFPKALDIIGHEYAGAVSEYSAQEKNEGESGDIAEGFADAMGESLESYEKVERKEGSEEPDWVVGKNAPSSTGAPFRSLKEPSEHGIEINGKEYQDAGNLSNYVNICADNEGIHENSTIISHAFYILVKRLGAKKLVEPVQKAAQIFFVMQSVYLEKHPLATLEEARIDAIEAAKTLFGENRPEVVTETSEAFNEVGLNGLASPPSKCIEETECIFANTLKVEEPAHGTVSALDMLATLYRARGELAQPSAAGRHFLPLYEEHMGRITELVSRDPALEEMAVGGLHEITPALNALMEGQGQKFKLSASEMAQIEASLKRLAQDDRLFSGGGTLAELIERELKWLHLPSYAGSTYEKGFKRLNTEVVKLSPPPTATIIVDPNCSGTPYHNEFQVNGLTVATPGHYKPGEASPLVSSGVICGTSVEVAGEPKECKDKGTLNTGLSLKLPPGDKVNKTAEMEEGAYVGKMTGRFIACAGEDSAIIFGETGINAIKSPSGTECPKEAIACYEVHATYENGTVKGKGFSYAWVEEVSKRLVLKVGSIHDTVEEAGVGKLENVPLSFSQFGVEMCARAGKAGGRTCGVGTSVPWVHENGGENQPGCTAIENTENTETTETTENGRYVLSVTNKAKETTLPDGKCVYWGEYAHKLAIDGKNSLSAVSCVPGTTDCVVTDNSGNALYATNVSATKASKWKSWTEPTSPGEAISCPTTALCALGDGKVSKGGGGNMYYTTSLEGGKWNEAFKPTNGVLAVSCSSSSFCVDGQEGGSIRYATKPASTEWTEVTSIGSSAMNGVSCLSSSFCAAVNGSGDLYVADTEAHIKEAAGWKSTDIDEAKELHGIACTSTTSCVAVDGAGNVINLAIKENGEATLTKHDIDGTNDLTAISCVKGGICVAVDKTGNVFVSSAGGATWNEQHTLGTELTSVSCASSALCVAADTSSNVTAFVPAPVPSSYTQEIDSGNKLNAVSCIPGKHECVVADSKGNAMYATGVNPLSSTTWESWSGLASPSEAVACPASSLCMLADGNVTEGIGGKMYYATSLGGKWTEAFSPKSGVLAISCPSTSFCVDTQESAGNIRYTTNPASSEWTALSIGSGGMKAVDCLSSSFCAVVDGSGHIHVATTEAKIKEASGWISTDIDETKALHGIACASTEYCVAIDETGNVLELAINSSGEAKVINKEDIDGTNKLTAIACTEGVTCVVVDNTGNVFTAYVSALDYGGEVWQNVQTLGTDLTSVSCSVRTLCVAASTKGEVTAFEAE
jgi:Zn-dependent metalloprotease